MSNRLDQYHVSATDWRETLRRNQRNTRHVIFLFIVIYVALGFIVDLYMLANEKVSIEQAAAQLLTLKAIPYATIIMLIVAVLSVLITLMFHKDIMMLGTEYHEVQSDSTGPVIERQFYNIIEELKIAAGLRFMPKVYIIEADYMNAFASGMSEKSAMVAITRGLLNKLDRDEVQAVMAHEISHVRHADIKLTMTVAILSNLILIVIDLVFRVVLFSSDRNRNNVLASVLLILRFVLPIVTILLTLYLSRKRELMADSGCVELTRMNEPLARALLKIDQDSKEKSEEYSSQIANTPNEGVRQSSYFYDPNYAGFTMMSSINSLFSTHPPLEERLKALGFTPKAED